MGSKKYPYPSYWRSFSLTTPPPHHPTTPPSPPPQPGNFGLASLLTWNFCLPSMGWVSICSRTACAVCAVLRLLCKTHDFLHCFQRGHNDRCVKLSFPHFLPPFLEVHDAAVTVGSKKYPYPSYWRSFSLITPSPHHPTTLPPPPPHQEISV